MKQLLQTISILTLCIFTLSSTSATYFKSSSLQTIAKNDIASGITIKLNQNSARNINLEEAFIGITKLLEAKDVLNYWKINLKITWADKWTDFYKSIQKFVTVWTFPNKKVRLVWTKNISAYSFLRLAEKTYNIHLIQASQIKSLKKRTATTTDLKLLKKTLAPKKINTDITINTPSIDIKKSDSKILAEKKRIFNDVQKTLLSEHYDKDTLSEIELIEAATVWLTKGTWDKFTTYFPPTENKSFMESLDGKFEGIWSYVEMQEPWVMKIVTPITGSPSEKAGLKWWDQITHVDGKEILKTTSIAEAISWVKWPKWTTVKLTIKRWRSILEIPVIRDTIIIKNVEHKKINSSTYYIKLISFGDHISTDFKNALVEMKKQRWIKKIIIDLRNNPGWYLNQVSDMLSYFVPKWDETVIVKYLSWERNYYSRWYDLIDFSRYRIIILQNSGSASAAEIMAWTIKDYFPKTTIIWEQSYGKGSVQTIKPYSDGSSLKYTIAKWFTGKTSTWIDGVWIPVDVELEFDFDRYQKNKYDNQLERAKNIR